MNTASTQESSFRDKVATVDGQGKRIWIFPQQPQGKLYRLRSLLSIGYLLLFFALPFLKVDGHPLFMINILERRFILFGQIFWPQDFFIFGLGMVVFIVFITLFTVIFGRVFCGWACPQTIFMEMVFRRVEYWIEGSASQQKMLAQAPWTFNKIARKSTKWLVFWVISFIIANTFLAYIIGIDELKKIITEPVSQHAGGFSALLIFTTVFFFVYLWFREQVCTVVCPYGRLQGVLLDRNSIVVAYDHKRGEPRGKYKKKEERSLGDCIDCNQCVKVCPTGIDIRNGTQLECINCTACIDACDRMMEATGMEPGLIRFASESNISDRKKSRFTGRMKAYSVVMVALLGVLVYLLSSRTDIDVKILRTPGQLYQEQADGISNLYNYKLLNKTFEDKQLELRLENTEGNISLIGKQVLRVPKGSYATGSMFIKLNKNSIHKRKTPVIIGIYEEGQRVGSIQTSFLGPFGS